MNDKIEMLNNIEIGNYKDSSLSSKERAEDLLNKMNLDEKSHKCYVFGIRRKK